MDAYPKASNPGFQDPYFNQMPMQQYPPPYPQAAPVVNQAPQINTTVVSTAPSSNVVVVAQPTYKDYMWLSIMNLLCCCLPIGIAALVFSCKTRDSVSRGDMNSAASDSRTAFTLNMVALGLGLAVNIAWVGYVIYYVSASSSYSRPYSYYYYGK